MCFRLLTDNKIVTIWNVHVGIEHNEGNNIVTSSCDTVTVFMFNWRIVKGSERHSSGERV